jgi:hypothetical protein
MAGTDHSSASVGAQPFRDDDVERTAERFDLGKTENARRRTIPEELLPLHRLEPIRLTSASC